MQALMSNFLRIAMMVGVVVLTSCGADAPVTMTAPVKFSFPVGKSLPTTVSSVELSVSGSDMTTITSTKAGPFTSDISFSVDVPVGSSRTFTATATIENIKTEGYQGAAVADVTAAGGSVPITMLYVNFSTSPASTASGPQVASLSAVYDNTDVTLFVDFSGQVDPNTISGVVEFIPDAAATFRSQSIINELKGAVDLTMPSPGSNFIMFNGMGTGLKADLYSHDDQPMVVPVQAVISGFNTIEIRMSQAAFKNHIDSAIVGKFNVLVGSISSSVHPLTPTTTVGFTASSAAVGAGGKNVILYNASFGAAAQP